MLQIRPLVAATSIAALSLVLSAGISEAKRVDHKEGAPNVRMAYDAIISSLISAQSKPASGVPSATMYSPDSALLGLAVLDEAAKNGDVNSLINLLMFKRDGEFAESYQCVVLKKKARLQSALLSLKPKFLHLKCLKVVEKFDQRVSYGGIDSNKICWGADHIGRESAALLLAMKQGRMCREQ